MEFLQDADFWIGLVKIIWINIILSGDNAVVIALAARSLPPEQQRKAVLFGSGAAVVMLQTSGVCAPRRARALASKHTLGRLRQAAQSYSHAPASPALAKAANQRIGIQHPAKWLAPSPSSRSRRSSVSLRDERVQLHTTALPPGLRRFPTGALFRPPPSANVLGARGGQRPMGRRPLKPDLSRARESYVGGP